MRKKFRYKKFVAGFVTILFVFSSVTLISSAGNINPVIVPKVNSSGGRTVTVSILEITMEDMIDPSLNSPPYDYKADFTWKIWVDNFKQEGQGVKDDWDINYEYDKDRYQLVFDWDVGDKNEVNIKIELWDRDDPLDPTGDDRCDINGELSGDDPEDRYVIFSYSLYDYNEKYYVFNGEDDGTEGFDKDDDDAYMRIKVSDDYDGPRPKIGVDQMNIVWTGVKGGSHFEIITLTNIGESGSTLRWDAFASPNANGWGTWTINPDNGVLASGEEHPISLSLESKSDTEFHFEEGYITIRADRDDVARVNIKIIFTSHKNLIFEKTQNMINLLTSLPTIGKIKPFNTIEKTLVKPITAEISVKPKLSNLLVSNVIQIQPIILTNPSSQPAIQTVEPQKVIQSMPLIMQKTISIKTTN